MRVVVIIDDIQHNIFWSHILFSFFSFLHPTMLQKSRWEL